MQRLSIGTLEPRKNHAKLIESFGKIYEQNPNIRLFLVGPDGPARPEIDQAMEKLSPNARSRVFITGSVSDIDRTYLLKNAAVLAYASIYEGFGLPLLEAMKTKTPIVTSSEGSLLEVAGNAAIFVDPSDSSSIAKGILDVIDNIETRSKLVENGTSHLDNYSWEKSAEILSSIYMKVIKENN